MLMRADYLKSSMLVIKCFSAHPTIASQGLECQAHTCRHMPCIISTPLQRLQRVGVTPHELVELASTCSYVVITCIHDVTHSMLKSHVPGRGFIPPPPQLTVDGQAELRSSVSCDTRTIAIEEAELVVVLCALEGLQ